MKNIIILILIFISIHNCFSQQIYTVTAKSGLSVRNKPSIKGSKIGKLSFEEKVTIIEKSDFSFTSEKIKGYWVKVKSESQKEGYVFSGFLKPYAEHKIKYSLSRNDDISYQELRAIVNDKEIRVIKFDDEICFTIVEIQDYNNDGYEEVLLESNACGGNCCGNSLFVFSFDGEKFIQSDHIGYYFGGMVLNYDKNNTRHFIVDVHNIGAGNTTLCEDKEETYIFDDFNFKKINTKNDFKLETLIELKSSDFMPKPATDDLFISFDLDNNGVVDKIIASYWERWGLLYSPKVILNNKTLDADDVIGHPKRIGVLKSKTNNVNDLVIECDQILIWNGHAYEKK